MAVPILWRNRRQRYNLEGERCPVCERAVFPPRQVCPYCSREHIAGVESTASSLDAILMLPELYREPASVDAPPLHGNHHEQVHYEPRGEYAFVMPQELRQEREVGDD
jgi:hypothetical protein